MYTTTYLEARIAATEARILAYETAISTLTVGGAQSFTLDTGQTRQVVTMINITEMRKALVADLSLLADLCALLYGTGTVTARPAW